MQLDVWDLIKLGRLEEACALADAEFQENGDTSPLRNKVFALLQLGRFDEAIRCSKQIIQQDGDSESEFIFLGIAHWLKGEIENAIISWKAARNSKYTDAAGGVEVPMLLLFAAVKTADEKLKAEAHSSLKKATKSKRMMNWPGPLALYLLDAISEVELRSRVDSHPILHERQSCQADFYVALKRLSAGDREGFKGMLRACVTHGPVCGLESESYLAKGELKSLA